MCYFDKILNHVSSASKSCLTDYIKISIKVFRSLTIPISSGGWKNDNATFLVSENKTRCLLRLDLQGSMGIDTVQRNPPQVKTVRNVVENLTSELILSHFVKKFPLLFTRLGRSKSHSSSTYYVHGAANTQKNKEPEGANPHSGPRVGRIKGIG